MRFERIAHVARSYLGERFLGTAARIGLAVLLGIESLSRTAVAGVVPGESDIVAQAKEVPPSRESLFGDDLPKRDKAVPAPSKDSLFGDDVSTPRSGQSESSTSQGASVGQSGQSGWRGYLQGDLAYTHGSPEHWSKARMRLELGRQGSLSSVVKYKITGRFDYDAVFDFESTFYPTEVRKERRRDFELRESYLDIAPGGDWEFRIGRQHVVWGEVPGLFFADIVSAKDLREFVLPEFDSLRIPQWAVRAEYFQSDVHVEALWIPWPTVDRIGKPGNDFFPYPPFGGAVPVFQGESKPKRSLRNSNFGLRASTLKGGWDIAGFAYRAIDNEATFYRQVVPAPGPTPIFVYSPRHDRVTQVGATVAKDLGQAVLKAEVIGTRGKGFSVQGAADVDGVARLDLVDYLVGLDFTLPADSRLNAYFFQRHFTDYQSGVVPDRTESGLTFLVSSKVSSSLELQALLITSLNRSDWMFRPKVTWSFSKNWRLNVGADVLHGPQLGFFGRYANQDRVYADVRYSF